MGVTTRIRDELRLARLKERLEDRPNNLHATVQAGEATVPDLSSCDCYLAYPQWLSVVYGSTVSSNKL